jgi:hypothetical protein
MFSSLAACWLGQLDVAELALAEQRDFARLALVAQHHALLAGSRHVGQALDLDRNGRTGLFDRLAVLVQHGAHAAEPGPASSTSPAQGADCTSMRGHRTAPLSSALR